MDNLSGDKANLNGNDDKQEEPNNQDEQCEENDEHQELKLMEMIST